ncbi:hypothetical protein J3Q64DRAFT_1647090 [Phycomyces blakesleeanus]|uniref:Negative elongation factor B n=1 Tax=Phycomyces blakesleeanus TaxID=4837 RepID=A0ABR3ALX6_PHYBL
MSKTNLIGPAEETIKAHLSQSGDPLEAIRTIQRIYGLDLPGIEAMYPLLDLAGYSRHEVHLYCLDALNKAILARIESPDFTLNDFRDLYRRTSPYIHIPYMQPVPMALLKKFEKYVDEDILSSLKNDEEVFENCPLNIKQRIWKQDEGFFQGQMLNVLNDYHHNERLQALAMNLKPESYQGVIEESLSSLRVDLLMNVHDQDIEETVNGEPLYAEFAMILMDPIISNFLSSCIVRWLRNSVDEGAPGNLEDLINYNAKLLNLAEHAPRATGSDLKIPKIDRDIRINFWHDISVVIINENTPTNQANSLINITRIESIISKSEVARKIYVHYLIDRASEGDITSLSRCLPSILNTLPSEEDKDNVDYNIHLYTYQSFFRTFINIIIKRHLVDCVMDIRWRQAVVEEFLLRAVTWDFSVHEQVVKMLNEYFKEPKHLPKLGEQVAVIADWADKVFLNGTREEKVY